MPAGPILVINGAVAQTFAAQLQPIVDASRRVAASLPALERSLRDLGDQFSHFGRRYLRDHYGRLPVLAALRGIASEQRETRGRPWHPRVLGRWMRTQYDLTPGLGQ